VKALSAGSLFTFLLRSLFLQELLEHAGERAKVGGEREEDDKELQESDWFDAPLSDDAKTRERK